MDSLINVLIVEDHKLIREAWTSLLSNVEGIKIVGTADNANDAYNLSMQLKPQVVLMDINLKESSGLEATEKICNSLAKTRVIGLSLHDDISFVKKFLSLGARGYLTKNTTKTELVDAITKVFNDEIYIANELKDRYFTTLLNLNNQESSKELTLKEIEIVKLISQGQTSKEIGEKLFISPRTVETHRHNILKKLNIPNAAQLSSWAKEKGYV
jgi:DNA-binding NarL/FixJ family response regulator